MAWFDAVATGIGSVLGYFGQQQQNQAMLQATRETNEQNYQIWQEQQRHNMKMFNMENQANISNWQMQFDATNAYNDPSAQVERLRNAGLNPSLAIGNNASGIASSSPVGNAHATPAGAPTMQAPPPEAFQSPMVSALNKGMETVLNFANLFNTHARTENVEAVTENVETDTENKKEDTRGKKIANDVADKWASKFSELEYNNAYVQYQRNKQQYDIESATMNDVILHQKAIREAAELSNVAQRLLNDAMPEQLQANLALTIQQEAALLAQEQWSLKDIDRLEAEITNKFWNNRVAQATIGLMGMQGQWYGNQIQVGNSVIGMNNSISEWYDSQTDLNTQQWSFNNDMNPLLIAGQTQSNLGQFYDNDEKRLKLFFGKSVIRPMIENAVSGFQLGTITNKNQESIQNTINSAYGMPGFGSLLRGIGGAGTYIQQNSPIQGVFQFGK